MSAADLKLAGEVFLTLFVIMDPPGAVPIFLALTARMTPAERAASARRASLVAFEPVGDEDPAVGSPTQMGVFRLP